MINANLLIDIDSFNWKDLSIDYSEQMDNLILALEKINEVDDDIYSHPESYNFHLGWGYLHELLTFDQEQRQLFISWLDHNYQKTLINLFNRSVTPRPSHNLIELNEEFPNQNNGLLGIAQPRLSSYVSCDETWLIFHQGFIKANYHLRETQSDYFKRFYQPELRVKANQIQELIDRGQVDPLFDRLDAPFHTEDEQTLHGETIQIHFKDAKKSALNINGVWKHEGFDLPTKVKSKLIEWGFLLPE